MAYALVGTIGAVSLGAANTAVTPAWGTSENRTAKNLLICWVAVHGTATLPTTPGGWSIGVQKAGTSMSVTAYYKVAAGTDAAPQIGALGASTFIQAQLAEFSGGADGAPIANAGVGTAGLTSPIVATLGAIDPTTGTLVVVVGASFYSAAATKTLTHTVTGGAATITASQNNATSLARHYAFGRGPTTTNAGADSDSFAQTTTSITGGAVGLVSFLLGPPVTSAPTAASMTLTGATPTVSAVQTYAPSAAAMTLTGATPVITMGAVSLPTAAAMTLTGAIPVVSVTNNVTAQPTAASLTLTPATPAVATPVVAQPASAALVLTPATPAVLTPKVSVPTAAALTLSGATPAVLAPVVTLPGVASFTLSGATPAVLTPVASAPSPVALTLTGATPTVLTPILTQPTAASLVLTGATPDISQPIVTIPGAAAMSVTGATPTVLTPILAQPGSVTLAVSGAVPTVTIGSADVVAVPGPASLTLMGAVPDVMTTGGTIARSGALMNRAMQPVPYRGPQTTRVISKREIALATARFSRKRAEEEWLLGLITDQQMLEAA